MVPSGIEYMAHFVTCFPLTENLTSTLLIRQTLCQDLLGFAMLHVGMAVTVMCLGAASLLILPTQMNVPGEGSLKKN